MKRLIIAATLALSTTTLALPSAFACGHDMAEDIAILEEGPSLGDASMLLEDENYTGAIAAAVGAESKLGRRSMKWAKSDDAQLRMGAMVVAASTVRLEGKVYLSKSAKRTKSKSVAKKNLNWARKALRALHAADPDNTEIASYYGEALALSSKKSERAKGRTILSGLAGDDLLTSAHAWAALAKLHKDAKAPTEANEAVGRCMAMSGDDANLCGSPVEQAMLSN